MKHIVELETYEDIEQYFKDMSAGFTKDYEYFKDSSIRILQAADCAKEIYELLWKLYMDETQETKDEIMDWIVTFIFDLNAAWKEYGLDTKKFYTLIEDRVNAMLD